MLATRCTEETAGVRVARAASSVAVCWARKLHGSLHKGSIQMNMTTLLIVVLLLFVFGGGGGYYWNRSRR